jgi:hypothetical protein
VDQLLIGESTPPADHGVVEVHEAETVEFEDVSELDVACNEILTCASMKEVSEHWKAHRELQTNEKYVQAKDKAKERFSNEAAR